MKKSHRIAAYIDSLPLTPTPHLHPCYTGYFTCFNACDYYEAHDVLEHLWLECTDSNHLFYKGLIQIAGAFVHLKKQHARPWHPTDGRRMHPATRLFRIGSQNIVPYGPVHLSLDIVALHSMCDEWCAKIEQSAFSKNPWTPKTAPRLELLSGN